MLAINGNPLVIQHFPDGTLFLKDLPDGHTIRWCFENNEELVALQFIVYHLRDKGIDELVLELPYLPNARQDRVKSSADVFTLKHFATCINQLHFSSVKVLDPHSAVAFEVLERVEEIPVVPFIEEAIRRSGLQQANGIVFFPDAGAKKRYAEMVAFPSAYGVKKRDWETGVITSLEIEGALPEAPFDVLIIDDICSYGGTFLKAAQALKTLGAQRIYLYVTHCETNIYKGELLKQGLIERVFTTEGIYKSSCVAHTSQVEVMSLER